MVEHQDKAREYRNAINMIDAQEEHAKREAIRGKCFHMNAGTKEQPSWHGYARVERFDENMQPRGTTINWYTENDALPADSNETSMMQCELNDGLHYDWLVNGEEISEEEFKKFLNLFLNNLRR